MPFRERRLLENINFGSLFGYVQCDIEIPENLREGLAKFSPIFKNINVGGDGIGPFVNENIEKEGFLTQRRRILISSFFGE